MRHAADDNENRRRLLREQLERPPQAQGDDESDDWGDEDDEELEEEPDRRSRRSRPSRRASRRSSRRARAVDTGMIDRATVDAIMTFIVRFGSIALLVVSAIGSIGAFNGDTAALFAQFPYFWQGASRGALIAGGAAQLWVTGVEYWKAPSAFSLRALLDNKLYTIHLGVDVVLTFIGYRPIVVPWIQGMLQSAAEMPATGALIFATILAFLAALSVAVVPERLLVKG